MAGLVETMKGLWAARKFSRSPLGQALSEHTAQFFYSGQVLSWVEPEVKQQLIQDLYGKLTTIQASDDAIAALRREICEYVIATAKLSVLALTEEEKVVQPYAANPYISGSLHHHIADAAPHCGELAKFQLTNPDATQSGLVSFANSRSSVMLYYLNGLNIIRRAAGDLDPVDDWFQPTFEAQLVWEEDLIREAMGITRLTPEPLHALPYSTMLNLVGNKTSNPFTTWADQFPGLYLAGRGPLLNAILVGWRAIHNSDDVRVDVRRYVPGSVPTWAQWSGSTWVARREQRLRDMDVHTSDERWLPDENWLHLSLPPGWEPQHENERKAASYGRWLSETEWQPPPGRPPNSWQEA